MMNFVHTLCSSTPGQIQYGGFKKALAKKSGDMIRDRVRILYLLFLWYYIIHDKEHFGYLKRGAQPSVLIRMYNYMKNTNERDRQYVS